MNRKPQKTNNNQNNLAQWATEKEVIKTSFPIYLTLFCIRVFPGFINNGLIAIIGFFFFIFSKRARKECLRFQNQLIEYTKKIKEKCIKEKIPNVYKQIESFAITFVEKLECWVRTKSRIKVKINDDDITKLIDQLNEGKGAFVLVSHLGNSEVLRNLANKNQIFLKREVPVAVLMDLSSTSNFTNTIEKINPGFKENIIDVNNITPASIEKMQTTIEKGGMVVSAGDRISKKADSRYFIFDFLGKKARWSYGVYLIAMLLRAPVYFLMGTREKDVSFNRKYNVSVKKSTINTDCSRSERETNMKQLCLEFINELEKCCLEHPFQWYNFYDFWTV
ncbi:MAG: hypothetical protein J6Y36_02695 [Treponema sp.]|nr:hypothetical protein [Treponema sp.]